MLGTHLACDFLFADGSPDSEIVISTDFSTNRATVTGADGKVQGATGLKVHCDQTRTSRHEV